MVERVMGHIITKNIVRQYKGAGFSLEEMRSLNKKVREARRVGGVIVIQGEKIRDPVSTQLLADIEAMRIVYDTLLDKCTQQDQVIRSSGDEK